MNSRDTDNELCLSHYGNCIAQYTGNGTIFLTDGQIFHCVFSIGQLTDANIILICELTLTSGQKISNLSNPTFDLANFEGKTHDGNHIHGKKGLLRRMKMNYPRSKFAYLLRDLFVSSPTSKPIDTIRFGITNFRFFGTKGDVRTGKRYLPLEIPGEREVSIHPVLDYNDRENRLQAMKGIEITCELVIKCSKKSELDDIQTVANDLCYILSIARGTKIQWIYYSCHDSDGEIVSIHHHAKVTKSYGSLSIIDPGTRGILSTKKFIETVYPIYVTKRDGLKLNKGLVDVYLDSKTEHDYLQARGIKAVVVMEMLKSLYYELPNNSINNLVVPDTEGEKFVVLLEDVKVLIKRKYPGDHNKQVRKDLYANIRCINNTPFKKVIRSICTDIGCQVSESDLDLFVACRNKLIHEGRFYCEFASETDRKAVNPLNTQIEEYFFIVHFLDKLLLTMLGYRGPYISWEKGIPETIEPAQDSDQT